MPKKFWVSWYHDKETMSAFTLHNPWWISGGEVGGRERLTMCAALICEDEEAVREKVYSIFDTRPKEIEFRFCEERPDSWTPFNDRFQRRSWMRYPDA